MYCWICSDIIFEKYYLLPTDETISNNYNQILKKVDCFEFVYNILCENCLEIYLKNYPLSFKKIMKREIYGNNINKNFKRII